MDIGFYLGFFHKRPFIGSMLTRDIDSSPIADLWVYVWTETKLQNVAVRASTANPSKIALVADKQGCSFLFEQKEGPARSYKRRFLLLRKVLKAP